MFRNHVYKTIQNINETNTMLRKRNLEPNTNVRADAKHIWKENIAKNIWPNTWWGVLASQME
jgi:hypothetical protein